MRFSSLLPFILGAALIPQTYAWGAVGHEIVATIAEMHLYPGVMPKLCDILGQTQCHLAPVAAWADAVRRQGKYRWTAPLHYIGAVGDYPRDTCAFPGVKGWEGKPQINVLNAIRNATSTLQEYEGFRRAGFLNEASGDVQDALKFLIHFVGDMHQPLHLTGRNKGGNGDKVAFEGRSTNLHSVWDSQLISERLRTLPHNYTKPLPLPDVESFLRNTIYDPYIRRVVWEGLLGKWQDDIDAWFACPSSEPSVLRQLPREPLSAWQYVFYIFSAISGNGGKSQDGGLGADDDKLCPYAWAEPIHQLNCDLVYPEGLDGSNVEGYVYADDEWEDPCDGAHDEDEGEDDEVFQPRKSRYFELNTPEYNGAIKEQWIIEELLTKAGIRLAGILNWVFAQVDEGGSKIQMRYLNI